MGKKDDLSRRTFLKSSIAVDVRQLKVIGRIDLPATPQWMKVLTV